MQAILVPVLGVLLGIAGCLAADPGPMVLSSRAAAEYSGQTSNEAYPIGNGRLAAMVYGGVAREILQFNEDTVWAGQPHDYSHEGAHEHLEAIRDAVWQGKGEAAYRDVAAGHFMSTPLRQSPYQPTAELRIDVPGREARGYRRTLDLDRAAAGVSYERDGVRFTRETFASHPDQVIVVRLSASRPGSIRFRCSLESLHPGCRSRVEGSEVVLEGKVRDDPRPTRQRESSVRFQARVRVQVDGGTLRAEGDAIAVDGADAATLVLGAASNFLRYDDLGGDPGARAGEAVKAAADRGYEALLARHLADYQPRFRRVVLDLGEEGRSQLETAQRLDAIGSPAALAGDLPLVALNFQMARYLYLAGSRAGSQPLTLQGKWNNEFDPAWESKMTLNINQEMNYWAVETANLPECFRPMVDLVRDLSETGAVVAREHYGAGGWMVHHNTDLWRGAAPINSAGGLWPTGGAWLSMHLWSHYAHSGDEAYLAEVYPLMRGAARFFLDFLVADPRRGREPYLLTNPTHSPEHPNPALGDDGELVAGTTMDAQLVRALFTHVIEAGEILGVDADLRAELAERIGRLPPNRVGRRGQLQEWLEDVDVPNTHRHLSHLVGLFPGEEIHPIHEPELAEACRVVLDWKGDATNNTSWSQAWKMCLRNALLEGDHGFMILANLLRTSHSDSLTFSLKGGGSPENQIDGNLGAAMGTAMFFLQARRGEVHLLPALPAAIPEGRVSGLRAPGAFTVGIEWVGGKLARATLHSDRGRLCRLRVGVPVRVVRDGEAVPVATPGDDLYEFATEAGADYEILPSGLSVPTPDPRTEP